jgi:glycosyltransferase involved in cell wall biosynthesis
VTPLVTIGLPVYNTEKYLAECIESIKAQTLRDFEVIAILDCPTDHSAEILRKHADSRFRILENERNLGLAATMNRALQECSTVYLARMDADDKMYPERLRKQLDFMESHRDVDVLGTYANTVDHQGRRIEQPFAFCSTPEDIREEFRTRTALIHPTVMFRVERILKLGGYPLGLAEDSVLWLKALSCGYKFANLAEPLLDYRIHPTQSMSVKREISLSNLDRAYAEYGRQIWGDRAPNFVSGSTRFERLRRRIKRNLKSLFA